MKKIEKILALMLCAAMIAGLLGGCQKKPKRTTKETDETTYGIDVARYQGTIRWAEAAASGAAPQAVRARDRVRASSRAGRALRCRIKYPPPFTGLDGKGGGMVPRV